MLLGGFIGRVAAGVVTVGLLGGGFAWYQLNPDGFHAALGSAGRILAWLGVVAVLPFATFFLVGRVAKMDTNAAGAALVATYTLIEVVLLAWLFDFSIRGAFGWTLFGLGTLTAAAYNLLVCDWVAEKVAG
jgi:hypothetical protein